MKMRRWEETCFLPGHASHMAIWRLQTILGVSMELQRFSLWKELDGLAGADVNCCISEEG